jgi:glutathione synthase/RimK-type ligase-like ATP-grasp enzyme
MDMDSHIHPLRFGREMMTTTILIVSSPKDGHVPPVLEALKRHGRETLWFDTQTFPTDATISSEMSHGAANYTFTLNDHTIDVGQIERIWYRRPRPFHADMLYPAGSVAFAEEEFKMGIGGILRAQGAQWMNYPLHNLEADYKPLQLRVAQTCGLRIPHTIITNKQDEARAFYEAEQGNVIYKTLSFGALFTDGEQPEQQAIYTSRVTKEHLQHGSIQYIPHLFQEYIEKKIELRINIVADQLFATEIHTHDTTPPIDWRRDYSKHWYCEHHLPAIIQHQLLALVHHFHLQFAAIDMIISPQDEYYFLEVNPSGQWMWLQTRAGVPIAEAIAQFLAGETQREE